MGAFAGLPLIGLVLIIYGVCQIFSGFYKGSQAKAQKKMDDILLTSLQQLEHDLLKTQELKEKATEVAEKGVITSKELVEQAQVSQKIDELLKNDITKNDTEQVRELAAYLDSKIKECSWLKDLNTKDNMNVLQNPDANFAKVKNITSLVKDKTIEGVVLNTVSQDDKAVTGKIKPTVHSNAEDDAWFIKMEMGNGSDDELGELMNAEQYKDHCEKEAH